MTVTNLQPPRPRTPRGVEPVLRRDEKGAWTWRCAVRWKDPATGRRKVEEFVTAGEAQDFWAHLRLARRQGVLSDLTRGETTVRAFVQDSWWPKYAAKQLERNTLKTYAPVWNKHLAPRVGHLQLRHLTAPAVQQLREDMEDDGIGAPTVRRSLAILQGICKYAVTAGEMKINPVREVGKPAVTRQLAIVAVSPDQVEQLRSLFLNGYTYLVRDGVVLPPTTRKKKGDTEIRRGPDPLSATLVSLLAYEGLRPEEALALEDRHVKRATLLLEQKNVDGRIVVGQKTGRRRARTHRSPDLYDPVRRDILDHRMALQPDPARTLLFPRPSDGEPWREHDWRNWRKRMFKPAVKVAGLPITRPYDLRHACASLLLVADQPLTEIAAHMGHSVSTLSEFYAHLIADLKGQPRIPVLDQIIAARLRALDKETTA